jgi:hypothetical protein
LIALLLMGCGQPAEKAEKTPEKEAKPTAQASTWPTAPSQSERSAKGLVELPPMVPPNVLRSMAHINTLTSRAAEEALLASLTQDKDQPLAKGEAPAVDESLPPPVELPPTLTQRWANEHRLKANARIAGQDYWQQPVLQQEFAEWLMRKLPKRGQSAATVLAWSQATGLALTPKTFLDPLPREQALTWAYVLLGKPSPPDAELTSLLKTTPPTSPVALNEISDLGTLPPQALPALAVLWQAGAVEQGFMEPADRFALFGGRWQQPLTRYEAAAWADWLAQATYL